MSDNILKLIPSSSTFIPEDHFIEEALTFLRQHVKSAKNISSTKSDMPRFIDQGANFEKIICPNCRSLIDVTWWQNAMDQAYKTGFSDLSILTPCCGIQTSLDKLEYYWPAGFARFSIEIRNPGIEVADEVLEKLEMILHTPVRKIWAHY
ncbi:MAG: hypothetical protein L0287_36285 [Anaerolineae bacterium]|nr:hypothetical protein [Anaerolineae bacterium]